MRIGGRTKRKLSEGIMTGLIILFLSLIVFSGYQLNQIRAEYQAADDVQNQLLELKPTSVRTDPAQAPEDPARNQSIWEQYADVVGWLTVDDTPIDYCFAKAENNDKYLRHSLDGEYIVSGTLFLDYRCERDLSGFNSIVFGHNMKNGTMFGCLPKFAESEYFNAHSTGTVYLADQTYTLKIFAYLVVDSTDSIIYDPNVTKSAFEEYVQKNAVQYLPLDSQETDRVFTLSTCNYSFEGARSVLIGKLIET